MKKIRHFIGTFSSVMGMVACGSGGKPAESNLKLTNAIPAEDTEFPAVVLLYHPDASNPTYCTATFINDHQAITAAHCLGSSADGQGDMYLVRPQVDAQGQRSFEVKARAVRTHIHPEYDLSQRNAITATDLAIIDFPGGTAPASFKLGEESPQLNEKVTLVGFGGQESGEKGIQGARTVGDKRYGSNTVKSCTQGLLTLSGLPRTRESFPVGQHVASAQGDSGSPWLVNGQLASVTIGGEVKQMAQGQEIGLTYAVDLNSESSRSFLSSVID